MAPHDADDLVAFRNVTIVRSTAPALLCRIGDKSVWLPRGHISGKLWRTGDRGRLFVRRWVARDGNLLALRGEAIASPAPSVSRSRQPGQLQVVRGDRNTDDAE